MLREFCSAGGHVYLALGTAGVLALYLIAAGVPGTLWLALIAVLIFGVFIDLQAKGY